MKKVDPKQKRKLHSLECSKEQSTLFSLVSPKPKTKGFVDFKKFDKAEKEIKEAEDAVQELAQDADEKDKELLTKAARDLEKAEAEVEEVDEGCF
jgi:hypothetical protein